ncbi:MAG: OmpA family protein [Magnetococcales bacterium]|nr:OmpA family protein [Magnetococcales bacterium]MBF0439069.1 OmpA family protein [Magnetococcales bacterium]
MFRFIKLRRGSVDEGPGNPFWISYADLMTALVMLFLVVMSISMVAIASRPMAEKKQRAGDIQMILNQLDFMAEKAGLDLQVNQEDHSISFGEKAQFAFNSYQLSPEAVEILRAFVPVLLDAQARQEGGRWMERVHIEGYTDAVGTYLYNVDLSLKRAESVLCALLSADLPPEKMRRLQELLIIDGASVTAIKSSPEESRRVEVRLEFRRVGDVSRSKVSPDLTLGRCAIPMEDGKKGSASTEKSSAPPSRSSSDPLAHWLGIFQEQMLEQ